jgi:chemotaxis protein MotB
VRRGNELVLRLDESVLFTSGDDRLGDAALAVLKAMGESIKDRPVNVRVEGHTDDQPISTGRFRSNWDLSTARATSVVMALAGMGDVKPNRLAAVGYAEYQPLGDNGTKDGRSLNRRVDFVLTVEVPAPMTN